MSDKVYLLICNFCTICLIEEVLFMMEACMMIASKIGNGDCGRRVVRSLVLCSESLKVILVMTMF